LKLENLTNKELEKINEIENEQKEIIKNFLIKKEEQPKKILIIILMKNLK
jgi:hypothetical protein